jgi:putrescine transport system substrate-binding protein
MRWPLFALLLAFIAWPAFGQNAVNVYNWDDYTLANQLQEFTRATGIKVSSSTYATNELLDGKLRHGGWGYDVVVPSATPFFARQVKAGLFAKLDRSKLSNWSNLAPDILAMLAKYDPGNAHGMPYAWGTVGIGYDVGEVARRMPDAPVDSLRMVFDPAVVSKFADCGVSMLDSSLEMIAAALRYLGLDPNSRDRADLARAQAAVKAIRPYVRHFEALEYAHGLGSGTTCLAFSYSGGIYQAAKNAVGGRKILFKRPKEGALMWIDVAAIPKGAANVEAAHRFLNYLMEPKVAAAWTETLGYASANQKAIDLLPRSLLDAGIVYPSPQDRARIYSIEGTETGEVDRLWERLMLTR